MHIRLYGVLSFCVVLWNGFNGQKIPEQLHKYDITSHKMFGRKNPTKETIDELIRKAMGDLKDTLNVKSKDDEILMELDMVLSKQQYYSLYGQPNSSTLIRSKRKALRDRSKRWTNGVIPYRFRYGDFSRIHQNMIRRAMREWERNTCLRFREATSSDNNSVVFTDGQGCSSFVGMEGGEQEVSLALDGCRHIGVYLHEIGHVIGLEHEHSRPDRDEHVKIIWNNVDSDDWPNFDKYTSLEVDMMNVPYDYYSIMHYGVTAFAKVEGWETIIVNDTADKDRIGNSDQKQPSFRDVAIVNKMYKCHAKCDPSIQCSGGYIDKNCQCVCENGSRDCQITGRAKPSGGCRDEMDTCLTWARYGLCDNVIDEAVRLCPKTCNLCGHL